MDVEKGFPFLEIRFQKEGRHKDHTVGNTPENVFPAGIMPETGGKPHDEKSKHGRKNLADTDTEAFLSPFSEPDSRFGDGKRIKKIITEPET